jgi:hypothetical protein
MFLLYHSDRCNTSETVFHWCYVSDLHTTHAVVCWVTTVSDTFRTNSEIMEPFRDFFEPLLESPSLFDLISDSYSIDAKL